MLCSSRFTSRKIGRDQVTLAAKAIATYILSVALGRDSPLGF